MRTALRGCGPALLASSGTVVAGLACLLAADLNNIRGLGPVGAVGVLCALIAMTTLLPAILVLLGRRVFWPLIPAHGSRPKQGGPDVFAAMGSSAGRRPVAVLVTGIVLLGALALGVFHLPGTLKREDSFTAEPESIAAMATLAEAFPDRGTRPVEVMAPTAAADRILAEARSVEGIAGAEKGRSGGGWTEIAVTAEAPPESAAESAAIERLRAELDGAHVGGASARQLDLATTNAHDRLLVIPLVLVSVLLVLVLLLRSLVAPLLLVTAVVLVWGAALGLGGLVFGPVFGFTGVDPGLPLLTFVFLVALGVDYGIFLMHRTREETRAGADPAQAALTALRTTGGDRLGRHRPGGDVRRTRLAAAGDVRGTGHGRRGRGGPGHLPRPHLPGDQRERAARPHDVVAGPPGGPSAPAAAPAVAPPPASDLVAERR